VALNDGIERAIGRIEGTVQSMDNRLERIDNKMDLLEEMSSTFKSFMNHIKGQCPLFTGKPLRITNNGNGSATIEPNDKSLKQKVKDQLPTAGWVTLVVTVVEFLKQLLGL